MQTQPKPNLVKINPAKQAARQVRGQLSDAVRRAWQNNGGNLAGFALIAWDRRGAPYVATSTALGPISGALLPTYAADVLSRIETVAVAQRAELGSID